MTAIEISVLTGPHRNERFRFQTPVVCTIGRGDGCMVRFTGDESDLMISRRHCEMVLDPPQMQLRDVGSRNGTYLNGKRIDDDSLSRGNSLVAVQDGDVITLGGTTFRISLVDWVENVAADRHDIPAGQAGARQECTAAY